MNLSAGKIPDKPAVHRTEQEFAVFGLFPGIGNVIENPPDFGSGKIRVNQESGFLSEKFIQILFFELFAEIGSSPALPNNRRIDGLSGVLVPEDSSFSLIGDSDRCNFGSSSAVGFEPCDAVTDSLQFCIENFFGLMLYPAGMRESLRKFVLRRIEFLSVRRK